MNSRRFLLAVLFLLSLAAFLTKDRWLAAPAVTTQPAKPKAFLSAEWGMTPQEVASANRVQLKEQTSGRHFYQAEAGSESRYQTLEAPGRFLNRDATISYTFRDGRLVSYHLFTSDSDPEALDRDMRAYLTRRFGPGSDENQEGLPLKMVWQTKDKIVNYWFYEDAKALSRPYRAGFGVQDRFL